MNNLLFAANAVLPVFLLIAVGAAVRGRVLDDEAVGRLSRLAFLVAMPALVFQVISKADLATAWNAAALAAFLGAVLGTLLAGLLAARVLGMSGTRTGTFAIVCHRSNLVIVGLAVLESAYGDQWMGPAGLLSATAVLTYNVLAVVCLTLARHPDSKAGNRSLLRIFAHLSTNPLVIGAVLGIAWRLLAERLEWWRMPEVIDRPLEWLRQMCLPLALIAVGASLRLESLRSGLGHVVLAALFKLVLEPALALAILVPLGVGRMYLAAVVICLSAPTAIATYTMVRAMEGDDELASQAITLSTAAAVLTMGAWLLVLKAMGVSPPAGP
jgi:predicted permease